MWPQSLLSRENLNVIYAWFQTSGPIISGLVVLSTGILTSVIKGQLQRSRLAAKRKRRRDNCEKALRKLQDDLSAGKLSADDRCNITSLSIADLVTELQKDNSLTPSQVLEAYQSKSLEVNKKTNAIVEPIVEAKEQAEALDNEKQKGLLYGVPVSIKDNYGIAGYDGDVGIARYVDIPYPDDAVIVKVLKSQGAIPFVKTNVPQTMISFETTNPIHGATVNPHDTSRGVGGSSGGEGALIAGGGSLLGFGSDIGGSIRIPASMCGVCGLKPTVQRISAKGMCPIGKGQACIKAAYGPLSRDVDGLILTMKALLVPKMYELDPSLPHLPFRNETYESKKPLKIGYFVNDGFFQAVPAMERGVLEAKAILKKFGHELVEWSYPDLSTRATALWGRAIFGDGGKEFLRLLSGDALDSSFISVWLGLSLPNFIKNFLFYLVKPFYPRMASSLKFLQGERSVTNWWKLQEEIDELQHSVACDLQAKGIDALICPGFGSTALPFGQSRFAQGVGSYTMLYNVLNLPAGSIPVTKVTKDDVDRLKDYPTSDLWYKVVKKASQGTEGLPVNVQVAALPWQEEVILRVMKELETGVDEGDVINTKN